LTTVYNGSLQNGFGLLPPTLRPSPWSESLDKPPGITELPVASKCKATSQEAVDDVIVDYVSLIGDLQPFSTTEKLAFKNLITRLAPNRTIMCRKTVTVNDTSLSARN